MKRVVFRLAVGTFTFLLGILAVSIRNVLFFYPIGQSTRAPLVSEQVAYSTLTKSDDSTRTDPPVAYRPAPVEGASEVRIVVRLNSEPPSFRVQRVVLSEQGQTIIDLELGEEIDDQEIKVVANSNSGRYRIFERYRTSMTVMDEGPHLDLLDWRHFDSPWTLLNSSDDTRFQTLASHQIESARFPTVTKSEMVDAVRKRAKGWNHATQLVRSCRTPIDYPCGVNVSSVYFRIETQIAGRWTRIGQIEVRFPMGC